MVSSGWVCSTPVWDRVTQRALSVFSHVASADRRDRCSRVHSSQDPSPSLLDGAARCLPPDELAECESGGDARASRLLSRALTRCVLTSCLRSSHEVWRDVSPDRVPLLRTRDGKPYLAPLVRGAGADTPHLAFNATNTGALIGVALTRRRDIGLDVEHLRRRLRHGALSLARRRFSRAEAARLAGEAMASVVGMGLHGVWPPWLEPARIDATYCCSPDRAPALPSLVLSPTPFLDTSPSGLSPDAQQEEVMKLWTLKEAYVKAVGCGISASPGLHSFTFDLGAGGGSQPQPGHDGTPVLPSPPGIALAFEAGHGDRRPWQFWLVQPQSALVAAVCVRGDEVGTPTRLRTFTLDAQDLLTPDAACGVDAAVLAAGAYLPVQVQADRA